MRVCDPVNALVSKQRSHKLERVKVTPMILKGPQVFCVSQSRARSLANLVG